MRTLLQAAAIVGCGAAIGLIANGAHPRGLTLSERVHAQAASEAAACKAPDETRQIAVETALALHGQAGVRFADVRPPADYAAGHVPRAVHLPCQSSVPDYLEHIAPSDTVIVYGEDAEAAGWVADSLRKGGWRDVRVMKGGLPGWRARGGAVESGTCEVCDKS